MCRTCAMVGHFPSIHQVTDPELQRKISQFHDHDFFGSSTSNGFGRKVTIVPKASARRQGKDFQLTGANLEPISGPQPASNEHMSYSDWYANC